MSGNVYKTEEGRNIVESMYRRVLERHSSPAFYQFFVPAETGRTHVLRFGEPSRPPIVTLHGSVSNSAVWLGNVSDFMDRYCVYCVDIPGEPGLSEPVRFPLASDAPYKWLSSLLDNLGIKRAYFVTMSLGSWYGLNFASRSPERVSALSMITTCGIVTARTSFIIRAVFCSLLGKTGQKMLNRAVFHKTEVPSEIYEFQAVVSKHFRPVLEKIPVFSDAQLSRITAPVQFFGGDHDALIDSAKTAARLKKILPHSETHVLNDRGHVILDQFPVIKEFLISN